jgi:NAD(P)H-dependent FMN reductase
MTPPRKIRYVLPITYGSLPCAKEGVAGTFGGSSALNECIAEANGLLRVTPEYNSSIPEVLYALP